MPSRKEIVITIKGSAKAANSKEISFSRGSSSAVSNDNTSREEMSKYSTDEEKRKSGWGILAIYAANNVKRNIESAASASWNRYVDMKEEYMAQNTMNAVKTNLGMVTSYASSIATGAKIGAAAGPVGAVVGAAVGAIGNGINRTVKAQMRMASYNEQNNSMNAQTNYSRVRMGLMDGGRGTEN